jgi:CheY-like chemotaxis protein
VQIAVSRDEQGLRFTVADTGPGIDEETQARLFSPFIQASAATARRHGGTGLGLSICKRVVELMGGQIWIESREGEGSRFIFQLPIKVTAPAPAMRPLSGITVMVQAPQPLKQSLEHLLLGQDASLAETADQAMILLHDGPVLAHPAAIALIPFDRHPPEQPPGAAVRKPVRARDLVMAIERRLGRVVARPTVATDHSFRAPERKTAEQARSVILVAEDNVTNRVVISKLLDRLGMVYDVAEDGEAALQLFQAHSFYGLVLTDFHMPRMDGVALAQAIRALPDSETPILALTADALPETAQRCLAAGMQGQMTKPLRLPVLHEALLRWLPRAAALRHDRQA